MIVGGTPAERQAACVCEGVPGDTCSATLDSDTGKVSVNLGVEDFVGKVGVYCAFGGGVPSTTSPKVAEVTVVGRNDLPFVGMQPDPSFRPTVLASSSDVPVVEDAWIGGVLPGPPGASDEAAQTLASTCTATPTGVFATAPSPAVVVLPGGRAELRYTLRGDAPVGAASISCTLTDSGGASLALPLYSVEVQRLAFTTKVTEFETSHVRSTEGAVLTTQTSVRPGAKALVNAATTSEDEWIDVPFIVKSASDGAFAGDYTGGKEPVVSVTLKPRGSSDSAATNAILKLLQAELKAANAPLLSSKVLTIRVRRDGEMKIVVRGKEFDLAAPDTELLDVALMPAFFQSEKGAAACDAAASGGANPCGFTLVLRGETAAPTQLVRDTQNGAVAALSVAAAAGAVSTTGTKTGIYAMITRAMLCPGSGPDKLDRTLNPLGLSLGGGNYKEYNGAVVGGILINMMLLVLCSGAACFLHRKFKTHHGRTFEDLTAPVSNKIDKRFILIKSRFGWLPIPLCFLYGGACVGAMTALMYSPAVYKIPAVFTLITFVFGFPYYTFRTVRALTKYGSFVDREDADALSWKQKVFWGKREWELHKEGVPGSHTWNTLHHVSFDAYTYKWRYFMTMELCMMLVLASFTAWQPENRQSCWVRALAMTSILSVFSLVLLIGRPYVAPYENVMEFLIAFLETVMMIFTLMAMGSDNPADHYAVGISSNIALVVMYLIVIKFLLDGTVFVIDEYDAWVDNGGCGSKVKFLRYWFLFDEVYQTKNIYCELEAREANGGSELVYNHEDVGGEMPSYEEMEGETRPFETDSEGDGVQFIASHNSEGVVPLGLGSVHSSHSSQHSTPRPSVGAGRATLPLGIPLTTSSAGPQKKNLRPRAHTSRFGESSAFRSQGSALTHSTSSEALTLPTHPLSPGMPQRTPNARQRGGSSFGLRPPSRTRYVTTHPAHAPYSTRNTGMHWARTSVAL